jgi:hypothetical protein
MWVLARPRSQVNGLWLLVIINTPIFVIFAISFTHPRIAHDWRSFGAFSALIVALFTEMRCLASRGFTCKSLSSMLPR